MADWFRISNQPALSGDILYILFEMAIRYARSCAMERDGAFGEKHVIRCRRRWTLALALAGASFLSSCSDSFDEASLFPELGFDSPSAAVVYEPELKGAPTDEVGDLLKQSLAIFRRQKNGAPTAALLRRRAEQDEEETLRILRSEGYYGATVESLVRPVEGAEPSADDSVDQTTTRLVAELRIEPGDLYKIASHRFDLSATPGAAQLEPAAEAKALVPGAPARAFDILTAESAALDAIRAAGRPWATIDGRRAVRDPKTANLTVETRLIAGPAANYGPVRIVGAERVDASHIASYVPWSQGDPVVPSDLRALQRTLAGTNLFSAVSVEAPETPPSAGGVDGSVEPVAAPITIRVEERPARSVSAGARYDTDAGLLLRGAIEHRNLFGAGESAALSLTGGAEEQSAALSARAPQWGRPGQDLIGELSFRHREDEAFEETATALRIGLERKLTERWTAGLAALVESARIIDEPDRQDVLLLGIPAFARYDSSDSLLDPTKGVRAGLTATPFWNTIDGRTASFFLLDGQGAVYQRLDTAGRHVIAGRARLGAILSSSLSDIPANRRLYSGGGGSVRGYRDRYVGPLDGGGEPDGGRLAAEAGIELRTRIVDDFGAVAFIDAGAVDRDLDLSVRDGVQTAAGVGLRYYSPIGPIRADIAAPLNPRADDDAFQLYFSIGQAF